MATSVISLTKKPEDTGAIHHLKPPVGPSSLAHKNLVERPDFRRIPAYKEVTDEQFLDHHWQAKKSITRPDKLLEALQGLASEAFIADATEGFARAPMSVRVSPYVMSLIDWSDPYGDPLRTQFIPVASRMLPDHPKLGLDSLHEQEDAPVPGLTHRYVDKALFLPLDTCPVYCRFCTRSYAVGNDTELVDKVHLQGRRGALGEGLQVHRGAPRARGHRGERGRRLPAPPGADPPHRRDAGEDAATSGGSASPPRVPR
jgi:lysine 2,3-aminomutase